MSATWIVSYRLPNQTQRMMHRRLEEILLDYGGKANCRLVHGTYFVSGDQARELAFVIAKLAQHFGASPDGMIVAPLGDVPPKEYYAEMARAEQVVDVLCVDRRRKANKHAPRSLSAIGTAALVPPSRPSPVSQSETGEGEKAVAWDELNEFLTARVGAEEMV